MKLKLWQIVTLVVGALFTGCLVCASGVLVLSALAPASTPTAVQRSAAMPVIQEPTNTVPVSTDTALPPPSPTSEPSPTIPPTLPPSPIPIQPGASGVSLSGNGVTAACVPNNPQERAIVTRVIDGDTIEVVMREQTFRVRYIGMDTPENTTKQEPFGKEATAKNSSLVNNQTVVMVKDVSETDQFDRLLRYVFVNGIFVNLDLVKNGYATSATYPPDVACADTFRQAEQEARSTGAGLWGLPAEQPTQAIIQPTQAPPSSGAVCNCTGPDLDCGNFAGHKQAQACFDYCRSQGLGDVFKLDRDGNGLACESSP